MDASALLSHVVLQHLQASSAVKLVEGLWFHQCTGGVTHSCAVDSHVDLGAAGIDFDVQDFASVGWPLWGLHVGDNVFCNKLF